jgi:ELWxxDGT repeat protein
MVTRIQTASVQRRLQTALKLFLMAAILAALLFSGLRPTQAGEGAAAILPSKSPTPDAAEPYLVKDLLPGSQGSYPYKFTLANDLLFFNANSKLWKSDGTPDGTIPADEFSSWPIYDPTPMGEVNGALLCYARQDSASTYYQLWKTDGTSEGTGVIHELSSKYTSEARLTGFLVSDDFLYFFLYDGADETIQLWTSDGTPEGTTPVKDLPVWSSMPGVYSQVEFNHQVYFIIENWDAVNEFWKTDGTTAGTNLIKSFQGYASNLMVFQDRIYISADDGDPYGSELWVSNGTPEGTVLFKDFYPGSQGSSPSFLGILGDHFLVRAQDKTLGTEPWISDGTPEGTVILKDINPGSEGSWPAFGQVLGTKMVFRALDATWTDRLWRSDGTEAGTVLVRDDYPIDPGSFRVVDDILYFQAVHPDSGREVWRSDGTADGTYLVADINAGAGDSNPGYFIEYHASLFFNANDGTSGEELWALELATETKGKHCGPREYPPQGPDGTCP